MRENEPIRDPYELDSDDKFIYGFDIRNLIKMIDLNVKFQNPYTRKEFPKSFKNEELNKKWIELKKIRDICNISIEAKRAKKEIGSSLEAEIIISLDKKLLDTTKDVDFSELCITSKAAIEYHNGPDISVTTIKALGHKCPVCWKISVSSCIRHPE